MKVCPVCHRKFPDSMTICSAEAAVLKHLEDPLLGQTLADKYRIDKLIKSGGMGSVYRGKHVLMDKTVAIKVLRPSLAVDDVVVARFSREAKAASRISHPHAVSVTDFGEAENGVVFLVMEYLDGRTLKEVINSEGALPFDRAAEIVRQVAGALDAAHSQGVVHRDLKSDNIMLVSHDGDEWVKVLDFGIAKIMQRAGGHHEADITEANLVVGTPQYMSPEQCSQTGQLDARSDIYSLGIIVYEMLTGHLPFTGESPTVIMMKQVQDPPPSILSARPGLPAGVEGIIKRALAKQPLDRFQSAGDLSAALTAASSKPMVATNTGESRRLDTVANTPVGVAPLIDDADEATVIRPRYEPPVSRPMDEAPAVARFNPWRVMIPAAIALVAVFALVFFFTRGAGQGDQSTLPLNADPNSQPVTEFPTPTGQGESDVRSVTVPSPTPAAQATPAATPVPAATVTGDFGGTGGKNPAASPTPRRVEETEPPPPPPKPSPSVGSVPKATPAKPSGTPEQS
jgi:eukaryotic-like serine/threonine-protein kinase